jgi:hypothetical protein
MQHRRQWYVWDCDGDGTESISDAINVCHHVVITPSIWKPRAEFM